MKYFKHFETVSGVNNTKYFQPEDTNMCIPVCEGNTDYDRMMETVEAGEAEIVEVDDTPVPTWQDNRMAAYGSWREQLDMMYHGTWEDHVASVKAANPKE
jgi:NADH:ubiquinone oxidoreductase subunit F (NADH-binding)